MRPGRKADNLTTLIRGLSRNFGSFNLLEPSGSVQACNRLDFTDAPYPFTYLSATPCKFSG